MGEGIAAVNSELSSEDFNDFTILIKKCLNILILQSVDIPQYHEDGCRTPRLFDQAGSS